ncbi:thiamine pyrophosphate-dependent enzyme [Virgibacillus xinjiangensis]|uniref:Thiamine pyrophosphate-dependent enzyme n=1 Tax=Virgibacillus xinjiangensis TaxID=393090 RepID=A0ABV7CXY0_9BACI
MKKEEDGSRMSAARALVACMEIEGIDRVFCVPGESYLPILDVLHDEPDIEVVSARQEGGAAFMAEAYAKSSGKPGVVFATRAVGAANASIGIHTAFQDSTPLVVFLGQVHRGFKGREGFQEADLGRYLEEFTKWSAEVDDPARMPEVVQRAFRVAQTGRPGPVAVSLPEDVLPLVREMYFGPKVHRPSPVPSDEETRMVGDILADLKKPVIIAGGGIKAAGAEELLVRFAEAFQIPVVTAFRRHDVFPNDHPYYAGHLGLGTAREILTTVRDADGVLAFGTRLSEVTTQDYTLPHKGQKLVHVDISEETIGKVFPPDLGIVADMKEALGKFLAITGEPVSPQWVEERGRAYQNFSSLKPQQGDPMNKRVIAILAEQLPEDAILTTDAGNFAGWLHAFYPFRQKHSFVGPTSGAMGYGMPAALGAKLAFPEKTVVSLSGDGGFMMTGQELETAVRYDIPVISLVFNNMMYGTIRMHQEIHYPGKVIGTDLGQISFTDYAKSLGADGYTTGTEAEFSSALVQALRNGRPALIEIKTDKERISVSSTISQLRNRNG